MFPVFACSSLWVFDVAAGCCAGDAYIAVAGLREEISPHQHALQGVQFAKDALASLQHYNKKHGADLSIRVGIHTGPLVAAVMGDTVKAYELYGHAFELSQKLESLSARGRIHISRETFVLVDTEVETEGLVNSLCPCLGPSLRLGLFFSWFSSFGVSFSHLLLYWEVRHFLLLSSLTALCFFPLSVRLSLSCTTFFPHP